MSKASSVVASVMQ